jgi:hypothetical protein
VQLFGISSLEEGSIEGDTPVCSRAACAYDTFSVSRVVWECSAK